MPKLVIDGLGEVRPENPDFFNMPEAKQAAIVDELVKSAKAAGLYSAPAGSKEISSVQTAPATESDLATAGGPVAGNGVPNVFRSVTDQGPVADLAAENRANFANSAVNFASNLANVVIHPVQTVENIGTLGKGVLQKVGILSGKDAVPVADAAGEALLERYGSWDAIKKTAHEDPVGFMADLSTAFGVGAGVAKMAGATGDIANTVSKIGAVTNPLAPVVNTTADIVGGAAAAKRAVIGTPTNPDVGAAADVSRALARDNMTVQQVQDAIANSSRPGLTSLADVGGENTRGLAERISQTPGAGRTQATQFLTDRQTSQLARVSSDLKDLAGTKQTAFQSIQQNLEKRSKDAAPLYESAYEIGDKPIWSEELARLTAVPEVQTAMKSAIANWQRDQIAAGYGAMNPGAVVRANGSRRGVDFTTPGRDGKFLDITGGRVPVVPNLQFWDYVKGHLDQMISEAVTQEGTATRQGRALTIVKNKMLGQLDEMVPQYAQARAAWSGPSAYISAVNDGKNFLKIPAEEVSAKLAGFESEAQREAYRTGAISQLLTKAGGSPSEIADITRVLRSPEMRGKISALMPNQEAAARWSGSVLPTETGFSRTAGRSLGGSQTFRRTAEAADAADAIVGDLVLDTFAGKPPSLFKVLLSKLSGIQGRLRTSTDAATANLLFNPNSISSLGNALGRTEPSAFVSASRPVRNIGNAATLGGFQFGRLGQ